MTGFLENVQPHVGTANGKMYVIRRRQNNTEELARGILKKLKFALMQNVQQVFTFYESLLRCTKFQCILQEVSDYNHFSRFHTVDCEWNPWVLGECSQSCGGGKRINTRTKKVTEEYGGKCDQMAEIEESCNIQECPGNLCLFI